MGLEKNYVVKVTTNCPGNCICCSNRQDNFLHKGKYLMFDLEKFDKICSYIVSVGGQYICLSGGEPTILPNLGEYIKIANSYGLATRINTNGWNVTNENLEEWFRYGLDQVVLSVYSLKRQNVKNLRGNETIYNKAINAARIISKFKEKNNLIFILQTVMMKDNFTEMPEILKLAIEMKADRFWPSYLEDAHRLGELKMDCKDIQVFKRIVIPKMKSVIEEAKMLTIEKKIQLSESLNQYFQEDFSGGIYHKKGEKCDWLGNHITFYNNGIVDPCPGHEYFMSEQQKTVDYNCLDENIDIFINKDVWFEYCQFCPQGKHRELVISSSDFHEHSKRED